jgi:flavin-dependent dehydrogenase
MRTDSSSHFDVIVAGGALAGSATAILLLKEDPSLRVLILERSEVFSRRVGEATVELSTHFLQHSLGLATHLHQEHLVKNGLRFWFANDKTDRMRDCSEIGGKYLSRVAAYLVDRAVLDQAAIEKAVALGAHLWRPAKATQIALEQGGNQRITVQHGDETLELTARWVVDATGVAATLARSNGWLRINEEHPTAAAWARWRGCASPDDPGVFDPMPKWSDRCFAQRGTATNHLMGNGWWAWWIPLRGKEVSVGIVFDQRCFDWPREGTVGARLKSVLLTHPMGRELLEGAECVEGDVHFRRNLSYHSERIAGDGFVLVGDAAGFLDPFYSPGLDWLAFTAYGAANLIHKERTGGSVEAGAAKLNRDLQDSYKRWFRALYLNKYDYIGEFDLMRIAVRLDVANYYMGVAIQPFLRGITAYSEPCFASIGSRPFEWWIRTYNRRLAKIGRSRRRRGQLGRSNDRRRLLLTGFAFNAATAWLLLRGTAAWMRLELTEGWRTWFSDEETRPEAGNQTSGSRGS